MTKATLAGKMRPHPILNRIVRRRVAMELKNQGHCQTFEEGLRVADDLKDEDIDAAMHQTEGAVGALGDGSILQKILDFLGSPQGQALIALLIKILLGGM